MGKIAVCPRGEGGGGWASLGLGRLSSSSSNRSGDARRERSKTRFRFVGSVFTRGERDRSGATSTLLGSLGLKPRKSDHLRGQRGTEFHGEHSLVQENDPPLQREKLLSFPLFQPNFISNTTNLFDPRFQVRVLVIFVSPLLLPL